MSESVLRRKSYLFAVDIVKETRKLQDDKEFVLSKQLLRSGTSIGANIREAEFAQSKADFIHKMSVSLKEANESIYWIDILNDTSYINEQTHKKLKNNCQELLKMLISTINTMKSK